MKGIISVAIDTEFLAEIDSLRKDTSRSRFLMKLLVPVINKYNETQPNIEKISIPLDDSFDAKDQEVSIAKGAN